ncbi:hypothetical protein K503DRAFT_680938 [Rhizopogon vinicolor AM-OR11-026]|uniref:FAR-17a/AIG1-like protein n=1 Tax=Rhizopogon vinicolor AM-OR11-026 TaxID=1314800 RepID=A0A1B7NFC2_9AGAM|nr:hypothetical protein K503DRAFT_680938 [Rhizopogon vinicolor AM-OR11-026]
MPRFGALFLHGAAVGVMAYGFLVIKTSPVDQLIRAQKGGYSLYLTIVGLGLAWFTMVMSLGCDLLPSLTALRAAKRFCLMISLPLEIAISTVYWSLVLLFPSVILQHTSGSSVSPDVPGLLYIPFQLDLCIHITPVVTLLADFLFFEKKYTKKQVRIGAPLAVLTSGACYASWVEYCATYNETCEYLYFLPYPLLTENPLDVRIGIYAFVSFIAWGTFYLANAIHS